MENQLYDGTNLTGEDYMMLSLINPELKTFEDARQTNEQLDILENAEKEQSFNEGNITGDRNVSGGLPILPIITAAAPIVGPLIFKGIKWIIDKIRNRKKKGGRLYASGAFGGEDIDVKNIVAEWIQQNGENLRSYESESTSKRGGAFYRDIRGILYASIKNILMEKLNIAAHIAEKYAQIATRKVIPSIEKSESNKDIAGSGVRLNDTRDFLKSSVKNVVKYALNKIMKGTKIGEGVNNRFKKMINDEITNLSDDDDDYEGDGDFWNRVKSMAKKVLMKILPKMMSAGPDVIEKTVDYVLRKVGLSEDMRNALTSNIKEISKPIFKKVEQKITGNGDINYMNPPLDNPVKSPVKSEPVKRKKKVAMKKNYKIPVL